MHPYRPYISLDHVSMCSKSLSTPGLCQSHLPICTASVYGTFLHTPFIQWHYASINLSAPATHRHRAYVYRMEASPPRICRHHSTPCIPLYRLPIYTRDMYLSRSCTWGVGDSMLPHVSMPSIRPRIEYMMALSAPPISLYHVPVCMVRPSTPLACLPQRISLDHDLRHLPFYTVHPPTPSFLLQHRPFYTIHVPRPEPRCKPSNVKRR